MAEKVLKSIVVLLYLIIAVKEVTSWTIDLPDVRRFLFEKNENYKNHESYDNYVNSDQTFYSNAQGNSLHNSERDDKYAEEYGYHDYMEKKVNDIVHDGSLYLEGLRRSLESYSRFLEDCNRGNFTNNSTSQNSTFWRPPFSFNSSATNSPVFNATNFMDSNFNFTNFINNNSTNFMNNNAANMTRRSRMSCREATEAREEVRRVADLSLWVTRRLQDLAYAKKYQKVDEREENELVLKLAWLLDRLAYLTGYEPDPKQFLRTQRTSTAPTTSPTPMTLVPSSVEQNQAYADCIRQNSTVPATIRCQYVGVMPDMLIRMFNNGTTSSPPDTTTSSMGVVPMSPTDSLSSQEILETSDSLYPNSKIKSLKKRSVEHELHYPPDLKSRLSNPHLLAEFLKNGFTKIKTVVKSVKSLKESTYKALLEKQHEKEHEFRYGSIPYLTIHKRSINDNPKSNAIIDQLSNTKSSTENPVTVETILNYLPTDSTVTNNKSLKKRSVNTENTNLDPFDRLSNTKTPVKSIKKRSNDDPLSKLTNYYIKHKVWDSSNPISVNNYENTNMNEKFDVKNHLTDVKNIKKRSLFNKKVIHISVPRHAHALQQHNVPKQEIKSKILLHLHKIHDISHKKLEKAHKIHDITHKRLEKAHKIDEITHINLEKAHKIHEITHKKLEKANKKLEHLHNIHKRSLHYEDMYLPRIPADPQGDISYYIKNKEGTDYNPSLFQAAQVRLGLEQVFRTGNIEVVRRYGANYNPAIPNPFFFGLIKTMSDA